MALVELFSGIGVPLKVAVDGENRHFVIRISDREITMKRKHADELPSLPGLDVTTPQQQEPGAPYGPDLEWWAGNATVIGVDEAGRGPLAGPVVAAAVAFTPEVRIEGIGDSKQLTHLQRERLFDEIISQASAWAIESIDPGRIDEINILMATREAMERAIFRVRETLGVQWPVLLVDGRIPTIPLGRHINLIKGDSISFSIGAASILAKVFRDHLMCEFDEKWPEYGFAQHKGYPTKQHRDALVEHGPCPIHRTTFTFEQGGIRRAIGDAKNGGESDE